MYAISIMRLACSRCLWRRLSAVSCLYAFGEITPLAVLPGFGLGVTALGMLLLAHAMPRKTDHGSEVAARWRAFRTYLKNIEKYSDLQQQKEIWDRWLPYAIAFGFEKEYIRKFDAVEAPAPGWYIPGQQYYGPYRGWYYGGGQRPVMALAVDCPIWVVAEDRAAAVAGRGWRSGRHEPRHVQQPDRDECRAEQHVDQRQQHPHQPTSQFKLTAAVVGAVAAAVGAVGVAVVAVAVAVVVVGFGKQIVTP